MLYIRADMNDTIATGHVMRCLAIADAARQMGEGVTFILADDQAVKLLKKRGYCYIILHTKWNQMEEELPALEYVVRQKQIKRLLIDSYQVTERYLTVLQEMTEVIYIDDLNTFLYPVHGLICYANYWEKFHYTENYRHTNLYLGSRYTPLRSVFSNCPPKKVNEKAEQLLILSGGTDPYDVLHQLLTRLDTTRYKHIDVICGMYYPKYDALYEKYRKEEKIRIHSTVNNVEYYMKEADAAISAGGTTLYELCASGTPAITYAMADNQLENVKKFQEDDIMDYAGDIRNENIIENITKYLDKYHWNKQLRQERSLRMQELVDGKGALRIAQILIKK